MAHHLQLFQQIKSFYKAEGYGTGAKKYILHFQGGSRIGGQTYDQLLKSALTRSKTILGSSKNLNQQMFYHGWFERTKTANEYYYNWNMIHLNYCDGTRYKSDPVEYNNEKLYFRGDQIVKSWLLDLNDELQKAELVIVSGCSAGGIAAYFWVDYIRSKLSANVVVYGVPDSGIFIDMPAIDGTDNQKQSLSLLMELVNSEVTHPNSECVKNNQQQEWKCYYAQYLLEYIKTPVFIVQSLYDYYSLSQLFKVDCSDNYNLTYCSQDQQDFSQTLYSKTYDVIMKRKQNFQETGGFAPSCLEHCFLLTPRYDSSDWEVPGQSGNTLSNTLYKWFNSNQKYDDNLYMDGVEWPGNGHCSNSEISNYQTQIQIIIIIIISVIIS
ncbi:unnamed protein product (macronuclear) [Paramecium tetraurelia]|uniref:Pectin acetylesterase n=1 Tax=Paramecium tetraurelia TaxID=5888 RepID=A0CQW8_PARTE|nr:uncharacterized protein GSPATT00009534001 [Paramecium tetraurelia]CAK73185.1 unnamed protein product [Paramecium tetraurelia]|eukprot:XP_001440582.1 hypothetical protein (macronuclear) [Paramecium tetraurelia strain d4-2]